MSKRHYYTPASEHDHTIPSDIPFRSDLVFYAPMTEQCCCDYVSGCVPIDTADDWTETMYAAHEWDAQVGMWKLSSYTPRSTQYGYNGAMPTALRYLGLELYSGVGTDNRANRGITLFCQVLGVSRWGNCYEDYMTVDDTLYACPTIPYTNQGSNSNTIQAGCMMLDINPYNLNLQSQNDSHTVYESTLTKCAATTTNGTDCKWYKNGTLKRQATNWGGNMKGNPTSVGLCNTRANHYEMVFYIKDVRIYNRVLTAQEVAQL